MPLWCTGQFIGARANTHENPRLTKHARCVRVSPQKTSHPLMLLGGFFCPRVFPAQWVYPHAVLLTTSGVWRLCGSFRPFLRISSHKKSHPVLHLRLFLSAYPSHLLAGLFTPGLLTTSGVWRLCGSCGSEATRRRRGGR